MQKMHMFSNPDFGEIRAVDINGEVWFVGKDVAYILGYTNQNEAIQDHVDADDKLNSKTLPSFELNLGQRGGWIINESGLYSLIMSSKLPTAKKFKRWVTSEVLPSLRKASGLESWEAFRMMDKEHQKKCMDIIHGMNESTKVDYIKANTIADKAVSLKHGMPKMIRKSEMTPDMLIDRQQLLTDTVSLMQTNNRFGLGLSVSKIIYSTIDN